LETQANVPEGCALFYKEKKTLHNTHAGQAVRGRGARLILEREKCANPRPREESVIKPEQREWLPVGIDKE
jgi:hypothetical protein